jgi:hypothetical protein
MPNYAKCKREALAMMLENAQNASCTCDKQS